MKQDKFLLGAILLALAVGLPGGSVASTPQATQDSGVLDATSYATSDASRDVLFQASTITALMNGVFDGSMTYKELGEHGDFGLGTFNRLDGEMVELDGRIFQVKTDGVAYPVNDSMITPFADVTFFDADEKISFNESANLTGLQGFLLSKMSSKNIFYAIRIDGTFDYVKTRSVPPQSKPYPNLTTAVKNQSIFQFYNQSGTIVGFWSPSYVSGVNVAGYHFHFLTEDRKAGGHLLDLRLKNASIAIDYTPEFFMALPEGDQFAQADLSGASQSDLKKIESNPSPGKAR